MARFNEQKRKSAWWQWVGILLLFLVGCQTETAVSPTPTSLPAPTATSPQPTPTALPPTETPPTATPQPNAEWSADLDFLLVELERLHPDLYHGVDEATFQEAATQLRTDLPTLDAETLKLRFASLVALVSQAGEDSQTELSLLQPTGSSQWLPLQLFEFVEGYYVVAAQPPYSDLVGQQVVAINGVAVEEVAALMVPYLSQDNKYSLRQETAVSLANASLLAELGTLETAVSATLSWQNGATSNLPTSPITDYLPWLASIRSANQEADFWLAPSANNQLISIHINRLPNNLDSLVAELTDALVNEPTAKIGLDLRHFQSGAASNIESLVTMLANQTAEQPAKLFALVGRATRGAAISLLAELKAKTDILIIGERTGGSQAFYGAAERIVLPHSGLEVSVATTFFPAATNNLPSTFRPDVFSQPSAAAHFANEDPALVLIERITAVPVDDTHLLARHYPGSSKTIIFANMSTNAMSPWLPLAEELNTLGYTVYTFSYRNGTDRSVLTDLQAVKAFADANGGTDFVMIGASLGGTAVVNLVANPEYGSNVRGMSIMAAPVVAFGLGIQTEDIAEPTIPKLFITTENDATVPTVGFQNLFEQAGEPKELLLYPGREHGTDIFATEHGTDLRLRLTEFVQAVLPFQP